MKINIFYQSKITSWGGGNQFLKALRAELIKEGVYSESIRDADVVIFNGYQEMKDIILSFFLNHSKKRIYRLGPVMSLHRVGLKWRIVDHLIVLVARLFADVTIFQSDWSYQRANERGFLKTGKHTVILNAVDHSVFYRKEFKDRFPGEPKRLIYTSWSSNMKKGFEYLRFLDENLDFTKYQMTFIGNSPFQFKNIEMVKVMPSNELSEKLRESDMFISPVEDDACSNALLEGLASGLPAIALSSGGNPEIVAKGGELFLDGSELLEKIDKVAKNLKFYYDRISIDSIEEVTGKYLLTIKSIC